VTTRSPILVLALLGAAALSLLAGGCGEKITIPQPEGLYSLNAYKLMDAYDDPFARQLIIVNGLLYIVGSDGSLAKRSQNYEERELQQGLDDPTALCADDDNSLIFVWEDGAGRLSTFSTGDLELLHATDLPDVQRGTRLITSRMGVDLIDAAIHTFVYITDPDSGVVHRYAYYASDGTVVPMGILCRSGGLSVRFVNEPAGMVRDLSGMLWVCDADTNRNWVIRFDPSPDPEDISSSPELQNPWRGIALLVSTTNCVPSAAAEYTLGDAPECGEDDWEGGPSDGQGEFHSPLALGIDGLGRIFVVDHGNNRVQVFDEFGIFDLSFSDVEDAPGPLSLGIVDNVVTGSETHYGAYVFVISMTSGQVHKFISHEEHSATSQDEWDDE